MALLKNYIIFFWVRVWGTDKDLYKWREESCDRLFGTMEEILKYFIFISENREIRFRWIV